MGANDREWECTRKPRGIFTADIADVADKTTDGILRLLRFFAANFNI